MTFKDFISGQRKRLDLILIPLIGIALLLSYHWIFSDFFPTSNGNIGHDYSYFLPMLLDGFYWQLNNGLLSPQWFTASFCGGIPALANPQNLYYSVPQWLSFLTDPLSAIYITNLIFAALGLIGFYWLLHYGFKTSKTTAVFGAALFLFNGFYASRMMIGHLTYHSFTLIPLIAFLLLHKPSNKNLLSTVLFISFSSVLFSYMVYAGMIHLMVPAISILIFIGLLHGLMFGRNKTFWLKLTASGLLGMIISLPKISSALAFLHNFERANYTLPGVDNIWNLLALSFQSLFLQPPVDTANKIMVNHQWGLGRHELEFGITIIPLIVILIGLICTIKHKFPESKLSPKQWLYLAGLALILIIPLALNYYNPAWNALLKETPILRNSSTLIRWLAIYIPIIILISAISLEKTSWLKRIRLHFATVTVIAVIIISANTNRDFYNNQPYSPEKITAAYQQAAQTKQVPIINRTMAFKDEQGNLQLPIFRNDTFITGASQMLCYEPIFGYRLESFPLQPLRVGRVDSRLNGYFNIKNPACYVYPETNECRPGEHFKLSQGKAAEAFVSHKPFDFQTPGWLKVFNLASIALLIMIIGFWIAYPFIAYFWKNNIVNKNSA